ncbi:MAG: SDR family NAD(P)-dependent oxidoreductase [Bauldia sp.]|nr:MAG: SDR family NAD(P)-dependent oxidoreductase [Bauldia sp.]
MTGFGEKNVIVTGGAGALGVAVITALSVAGATCYVPCLTDHEAQRLGQHKVSRVSATVVGDLADEHAVETFFTGVPDLWASIHLAGGFAFGPFAELGKVGLMQQIEMNLVTAALCCRAAVAAMQRTGRGGRIVNVAARPALEWRTGAGMVAYTASKAGVAALTVALAEEVVQMGILVNAVAPSILDTPANREAMPNADHAKWPKVDEVAATILFLASPENKVTRGAIVPVYGKS